MTGPHITELFAENLKRIKVVRIRPGGDPLVQITGANGSGKSSVLDAIYWALAGKVAVEAVPIRRGEESATIRLSLGEVTVTRRFTQGGSTLTVEAASGARFPSPQRMLDDLLGSLTFDPLAFERMAPKDRLLELRRIAPLPPEVQKYDQEARDAFERRTEAKRRARDLRGTFHELHDRMAKIDGGDEAEDVGELTAELAAAAAHNNARWEQARERLDEEQLAGRKEERARQLREEAALLDQEATAIRKKLLALPPLPDVVDVEDLQRRIEVARRAEEVARISAESVRVTEKLKEADVEVERLTALIDERKAQVEAIVASTKMPVQGLAFGEGDVLFNGLPFEQASAAERLRVSLAIAMASNPKLRVVRIKDGSLLDERSLALVAEMAAERDYQVWIERVDTSGAVGVVMEDGEVRQPAAQEAP